MKENRQFAALAAGLLVLGLLLRFYQIDKLELWLDEALTGYLAHSEDWLHRVHNSPPLYFLLTRAWAALFGLEETSLRTLSALSSGLLVPLSMYAGRSIFSRNAGIAAGLLVAVSPISIYYAQEARPYALLVAELMLVYWMLWHTSFGHSRVAWAVLLAATTAALYTHNLAVIPVGLGYLLAVAHAWRLHDWKRCRVYLAAGAASAILFAPWLLWWTGTTEFHPQDMAWLAQFWNASATFQLPLDSLFSFYHAATALGGNVVQKQFFGEPVLAGMKVLGAAALLVLCLSAACAAYGSAKMRTGAAALTVLLVAPLLVLLAISFWKPVYLPGRYDLIAYPAFVLLAGLALAWLKDQIGARYGAVAAYLLCAVFLLPPGLRTLQFHGSEPVQNAEAAANYLAEQVGADDLVLMEDYRGIRTVYYLQLASYTWKNGQCENLEQEHTFTCRFLPLAMESAPAAVMRHQRAQANGALARDAAEVAADRAYNDIFLLIKSLETTGDGLTVNRSIAPVLGALQDEGYSIAEARPGLNLLRLRTR